MSQNEKSGEPEGKNFIWAKLYFREISWLHKMIMHSEADLFSLSLSHIHTHTLSLSNTTTLTHKRTHTHFLLPHSLFRPRCFFLILKRVGWRDEDSDDDLTKLQLLLTNWPQRERLLEGRLIYTLSLFTHLPL